MCKIPHKCNIKYVNKVIITDLHLKDYILKYIYTGWQIMFSCHEVLGMLTRFVTQCYKESPGKYKW